MDMYVVVWDGFDGEYASQPLTEEQADAFMANLPIETNARFGKITEVPADMLVKAGA